MFDSRNEKYEKTHKEVIVEGELRVKQLFNYLDALGLPKKVWLSEDATGIVQRVEYDPTTNQLVGLVPSIDGNTGMPKLSTYSVRNAGDIEKHLKNRPSSLVYIVMAQPLVENIPPFLLQIFGTDNKFTAENVDKRWIRTKKELAK